MPTPCKGKILFLITEDWFFCLHRLPLARMLRDQGWEIIVATREVAHGDMIRQEGFNLLPIDWVRHSLNPLRGLMEIAKIISIYRQQQPDLIHHIAIKPCIYGGIASLFHKKTPIINNLAGLGVAFTRSGLSAGILRKGLGFAFKCLFNRTRSQTIVENPDDQAVLIEQSGVRANTITLIQGVGVDITHFTPTPEPTGVPVITLASRMIKPKGVEDLIAAARILKQRTVEIHIDLLGLPDPDNPASISEHDLKQWQTEGLIRWLGHQTNMARIWQQSNIAILPSYYREGIPRSLLEAAACGRAIITTDIPGCRELVSSGNNGLLVPTHSPIAIANAIEKLIAEPDTRKKMGENGRHTVEQLFSEKQVLIQMQAVYAQLLGEHWTRTGHSTHGR